jgi:hypothetical protein
MSKFTKTDNLYRAYLKNKRGLVCELCGKTQEQLSFPLSVFHILSKGSEPRLRYDELNTLIVCWTKGESRACHNIFHSSGHNDWADRRREEIKQRICALRGYATWQALREDLKIRARIMPKVDLKLLNEYFRRERGSE